MPLLPRSFEHPARRRRPDRIGEEGILHKVDVKGERFFVKHWYAYHPRQTELKTYTLHKNELSIRDTHVDALRPKEHEAIFFSPYWHKAVYFEQLAIHHLFPEHTIAPRAAYDPRIDPQQSTFNPNSGLPVTVAEAVKTDEAVAEPLQKILDRLYQRLLTHQQKFGKDPEHFIQLTDLETFERELTTLLQIDYELTPVDPNLPWLEAVIQKMQATHPHHPVSQLLQAGILPIHPAVNYLPTAAARPDALSSGVFVETSIIDQTRFRSATTKQSPTLQSQIKAALRRLDYWQSYDDLFERLQVRMSNIFFHAHIPRAIVTHPEVATALFRGCEHIRHYSERYARHMSKRRAGPITSSNIDLAAHDLEQRLEAIGAINLTTPATLADVITEVITRTFDVSIFEPD